MTTITALSQNDVLEFETTYYTDWKCASCGEWRNRSTPVRLIVRSAGTTFRCIEHAESQDAEKDEPECDCHCHDGWCMECGELA